MLLRFDHGKFHCCKLILMLILCWL